MAKSLMAAGLDEMRRIIREQEPARPSTRLSTLLAADLTHRGQAPSAPNRPARCISLRGDLDWIVMKALEKDRTRRYDTANGLAMDIQRHLNCEPVVARPPSRLYEFQKTVRRHTFGFAAGAALILVLTLGGLVSTWQAVRAMRAERKTANALLAETQVKGKLEQTLRSQQIDSYFHLITLAHQELSVENLGGALKFLEQCPQVLRGWEWEHLNRVGRVGAVVLEGTTPVYSVAFHPGGQLVAAACGDGMVKIWDVPTRKIVQRLRGHTNFVFSVAYRPPDGRYLASASADRTIRLWDSITGEEVFCRPGPAGEYNGMSYAVAFSPDGRHLVADRGDGTVAIWDADNGMEVGGLKVKHELAATCLAYSPDGKLLATGSGAGVLRIWDARTSELLRTLREHTHRISALSFASNGLLATASFDRTLKVWNPITGSVLRSWNGHSAIIPGLAFSPDGRRLVSCGGEDKAVKLWDPLTGREILNLRGHAATCHCIAFSSDGRQVASASGDGTIRIWDATPLKPNEAMESLTCIHDDEVWSVAFSPDGRLVASGSWDKTVRLWDARNGTNTLTLSNVGSVFHVGFSPDSRQLAATTLTAERGPTVTAWDPLTGKELFAIHENGLRFCMTFDPTGRYVLREGTNFNVEVWDAQTHHEAGVLGRHDHNIWSITFSPNGRRVATASTDESVKVWGWDPAHLGQPQEPELTLTSQIFGYGERVAFSRDEQLLISGGKGNTVKIWNAETGHELQSLAGHAGDVWAVALDRQARWLATAGEDTTIRIWDVKSWKPLRTLRGHTGVIMSLAFSPDGRQLVSGSRDHTVKFWDTARWGESPPRSSAPSNAT